MLGRPTVNGYGRRDRPRRSGWPCRFPGLRGDAGVMSRTTADSRLQRHIRAEWDIGPGVVVRPARLDDWQAAGRICHDAFAHLADEHGFPHDFPTVAAAAEPIH